MVALRDTGWLRVLLLLLAWLAGSLPLLLLLLQAYGGP
jgi:hypothetical protein